MLTPEFYELVIVLLIVLAVLAIGLLRAGTAPKVASPPQRWRGISFLDPHDGPVVPGQEQDEIVFAKNQPEYIPLRALVSPDRERAALSRWTPTVEQRERIAEGEDIYLRLLTFGHPLQPIQIFIAGEGNVSVPMHDESQNAGCQKVA